MPDQYDPKATRPSPRRDALNDPLAELAKIVQGRAPSGGPSAKTGTGAGANGSSPDLEAELLNDLQASFAAVRDALPLTAPPKPQPPLQPAMRGPIVEDSAPAPLTPPPAARAAPMPPPAAPPRVETHPELRDEFRLQPVDESRLVPIPPPPVIQPQLLQPHVPSASEFQPPQRPAPASERRPEPQRPPAEPPPAAIAEPPSLERASRPPRPAPAAETASDLGTFAVRGTASPAAAGKQAHSRWERPEPPKPQPAAPSRFAPPRTAAPSAAEEHEPDPFADAGLLGDASLPPELDDTFPLEGLGMVPGYGDEDGETLPPLDADADAMALRRGGGRGLLIAGAVVVIAIVGGVAVAMYRSGSGATTASSGTPPVITADQSPTKVVPPPATSDQTDSPNKLIYDRVDQSGSASTTTGTGDDTTLVTSNDEPIQDVQGSDTSSNPISRVIIPGGPDDGGTSAAATDGADSGTATDDTIGPKRVRTVVVKPDGTIVSSKATDAAPDATPPDTPPASTTAAASSGAATTTQQTLPTLTAPATPPAATATAQAANPPPAAPVTDDTAAIAGNSGGALTITAQGDGAAAASPPSATSDSTSDPTLPPTVITSGKTTTLTASKPTVTAAAKPTVKPPTQVAANDSSPIDLTPSPAPAAATSGVLVQISSQRTEDAARATYKDLQARYPQILSRYDVNIQKADLGDRGTFYRVRVGPFSQADAQHLCDDLRSAGGDCVLTTK